MSIDECIDELEWIKSTGVYPYGNTEDKLHTDDYIDVVIDTLKKYQKIKQIHKQWFCDFGSADAYTKIGDVLKDGNVD